MMYCEYCGEKKEPTPFVGAECINKNCPYVKRIDKILSGAPDGYPLEKIDYPPMPNKKYPEVRK